MHRLATSKGAIVMDMLSRELGREKLSAILKEFLRQHAGTSITWHDLQAAIEARSGTDIRWFFGQWFERTGAPEFDLSWKICGDRICGVITQPSPFYRATLEVELSGDGHSETEKMDVWSERSEFAFPAGFRVDQVAVDPYYKVLHWLPGFRPGSRAPD